MAGATFKKSVRLSSEKRIQELFKKGSSFYLYPFKVVFLPSQETAASQILISVPVRSFKKAVDRNKVKRRIREGYRLQKQNLPQSAKFLIAYIYTAKEIHPSKFIHDKLNQSFQHLTAMDDEKKK